MCIIFNTGTKFKVEFWPNIKIYFLVNKILNKTNNVNDTYHKILETCNVQVKQ